LYLHIGRGALFSWLTRFFFLRVLPFIAHCMHTLFISLTD
jgi:hypothetical protein